MYVNIKISKAFPEKAFKYAIGKNILEYTANFGKRER